jgi:hypothetical protein
VQLWQDQELMSELLRGTLLVGCEFQKEQKWGPSMIANDELVGCDWMSSLEYDDVTSPPVLHRNHALGFLHLQAIHNSPP